MKTAEEVLDLWFSERVRPMWFKSTAEFDEELRREFHATVAAALRGELAPWAETALGALALVICLDQLPLNIFRGQPQSFAGEALAREVAAQAIERGFDQALEDAQKVFLYMPYMHSERLEDQDRAITLYAEAGLTDSLRWAGHHRELVRRFGRFPHRNAILGRDSSPEELQYLQSDAAFLG